MKSHFTRIPDDFNAVTDIFFHCCTFHRESLNEISYLLLALPLFECVSLRKLSFHSIANLGAFAFIAFRIVSSGCIFRWRQIFVLFNYGDFLWDFFRISNTIYEICFILKVLLKGDWIYAMVMAICFRLFFKYWHAPANVFYVSANQVA